MGSNTAIPPDAQNTAVGIVYCYAGRHKQTSRSMDLEVLPGSHPCDSDFLEARWQTAPFKVPR